MNRKIVLALGACLAVTSTGSLAQVQEPLCEVNVWSTGAQLAQQWTIGPAYGSAGGVGGPTQLVAERFSALMTPDSQMRMAAETDIEVHFPSDKFKINYMGLVETNLFLDSMKKKVPISSDNNTCLRELILGRVEYQDFMFSRYHLYTMLVLRYFDKGKVHRKSKRMLTPLGDVPDMYSSGDHSTLDEEITQAYKTNLIEFLDETVESLNRKLR